MSRLFSINLGGGGGSGVLVARANTENIGNGVQNFSVVFSSNIGSANYALNVTIENSVDADPIYLTAVITNKIDTGFDVELSAPTDSANYKISYMACIFV